MARSGLINLKPIFSTRSQPPCYLRRPASSCFFQPHSIRPKSWPASVHSSAMTSFDYQARQSTLDYLNHLGLELKLLDSGISIPKWLAKDTPEKSKSDEPQEEDCSLSERSLVDQDSIDYLNRLSNQCQELSFSQCFSSLLAGSHNESDESIDLPIFLGRSPQNLNDLNHILKILGTKDDQTNVKVTHQSQTPTQGQNNNAEVESTTNLKFLSSLNNSSRSHPNFDLITNLLSQLSPLAYFEFGFPTVEGVQGFSDENDPDGEGNKDDVDNRKTICLLIGRRHDVFLGLIGFRIST